MPIKIRERALRVFPVAVLPILFATCDSSPPCGAEMPNASLNVAGTYRYASATGYAQTGTIAFSQTERRVDVTMTTYDNSDDRSLRGAANLAGNRLDITLVPVSGETDYEARVGFLFDAATSAFCVTGFTDSNGDHGGAASYHGERQ